MVYQCPYVSDYARTGAKNPKKDISGTKCLEVSGGPNTRTGGQSIAIQNMLACLRASIFKQGNSVKSNRRTLVLNVARLSRYILTRISVYLNPIMVGLLKLLLFQSNSTSKNASEYRGVWGARKAKKQTC